MTPVLAVDDVEANLEALRAVLRDLPIRLDCVRSAEEGLAKLLDDQYALALIDVQMPGMNGFEMAELMRSVPETERIPIIFITAGGSKPSFVFKGYDVGAVDYLVKPYEPKFLVSKVRVFVELYEAQEQLRGAVAAEAATASRLRELNEELSRFAAVAAHDLRSPLSKVMRFMGLLRHKSAGALETANLLPIMDKMEASLSRMLELVTALYDLYSMESREIGEHRILLDNTLEEVTSLLSDDIASSGGRVEVGRLPTVLGSGALLRQAFQNLVGNALKYAREGVPPVVTISGGPAAQPGYVEIEVRDNGVGFSADKAQTIFMPFARLPETEEREGLGIGLATVRKIVQRHGGEIRASGAPGEGATVTLTLPAAD